MRLIDADALLEKVQFRLTTNNDFVRGMIKAVEITRRLIDEAPTIETEPVKHGRWMQPKTGECFCSECKTLGSHHWKRCPVCEAKMNGGDA